MKGRSLHSVSTVFVVAGLVVAVLVAAATASAQTTTDEGTTTGATTTGGDSFDDAFWKIVVLSVLVALVWVIPLVVDLVMSYRASSKRFERLMPSYQLLVKEAAEDKGLNIEEQKQLLAAADLTYKKPIGVTGLYRTLFAFAILATIATVLFSLIALGRSDDHDIVQSIVAALVGAFTTIVGVYFGARTSEGAAEQAAAAVTAALPPAGADEGSNGDGQPQGNPQSQGGSHSQSGE
jgi:hypothetical protein